MAEWYHLARDDMPEDVGPAGDHDVDVRQEHLRAQQKIIREIFPTPTIVGIGICSAIAVTKIKPKTPVGYLATLAGGLVLLGLYRGCEMVRFILKQEMAQVKELQRQKYAFYDDVMSAVAAMGRREEIPRPLELKPVPGSRELYVYQAPACTPLWFRPRPRAQDGPQSESNPHDWQWSADKRVWMDTDTTRVPSGFWEGQEPAPSNLVFINRLRVLRMIDGRYTRPTAAPPPLDIPDLPQDCCEVPEAFLCPISHDIMADPVVAPSGVSYDRPCISMWLQHHNTEPATGRGLCMGDLYANLNLREQIQAWCNETLDSRHVSSEAISY